MQTTIAVDIEDPDDIQLAITTLKRLLPDPDPAAAPDLGAIVGTLADPNKYGLGRLGYLAAVAEAGDQGATVDSLLHDHFSGNHQAFGGTHASIEKTWRNKGGEAFAPKLIDDTA